MKLEIHKLVPFDFSTYFGVVFQNLTLIIDLICYEFYQNSWIPFFEINTYWYLVDNALTSIKGFTNSDKSMVPSTLKSQIQLAV